MYVVWFHRREMEEISFIALARACKRIVTAGADLIERNLKKNEKYDLQFSS
jgi:hypothetical protein